MYRKKLKISLVDILKKKNEDLNSKPLIHHYMTVDAFVRGKKEIEDLEDEINGHLKQLIEIANESEKLSLQNVKVEDLKARNLKISLIVEFLSLKLEEKKEILLNTEFVDVINVDEWNNLSNGLVDLNRDILMKLIKIIFDKEKIRNIIGMTSLFYFWSKLRIFRWAVGFVITVIHPDDTRVNVVVSARMTVYQLKVQVAMDLKVFNVETLIFHWKALRNDALLMEECGITNNSVLYLPRITVILPNDKEIAVEMSLSDHISDLKDRKREKVNIPNNHQRLAFGGRMLEDRKTLKESFIQYMSIINCLD